MEGTEGLKAWASIWCVLFLSLNFLPWDSQSLLNSIVYLPCIYGSYPFPGNAQEKEAQNIPQSDFGEVLGPTHSVNKCSSSRRAYSVILTLYISPCKPTVIGWQMVENHGCWLNTNSTSRASITAGSKVGDKSQQR